MNSIGITDELERLIPVVRTVRSELPVCPSAKEDVCITDILKEIIEKQVYNPIFQDGTSASDTFGESFNLVNTTTMTDSFGTSKGVSINNIFKYVAPKYLYVARNNEKHVVAIMCNYKFDPENGIAVIFENEKFSKIGMQDIIL